jgi:hypothetical protein
MGDDEDSTCLLGYHDHVTKQRDDSHHVANARSGMDRPHGDHTADSISVVPVTGEASR